MIDVSLNIKQKRIHFILFGLLIVVGFLLWLMMLLETAVAAPTSLSTESPDGEGCLPEYMVSNDDDSGIGSLRYAIAATCEGGKITFDDDYTIYLDSTLDVRDGVTIDGSGHTIIVSGDSSNDGSRNIRPFNLFARTVVTLSHMSIVNGSASGDGGGIYVIDGDVVLDHITLNNNIASDDGGGIYFNRHSKTLTVINSNIINNVANDVGGGIEIYGGSVDIRHSYFYNNTADEGGAVDGNGGISHSVFVSNRATTNGGAIAPDGPLTIRYSQFISNSAGYLGGALVEDDNEPLFFAQNSVINNRAEYGGGLYAHGDDDQIFNNTIVSNTAVISGGGIFIEFSGKVTMINNTLSHNSAADGGGLYYEASHTGLALQNNIIANSLMGGDCVAIQAIETNIHNLIEDGSCNQGTIRLNGFVSGDPKLANLAENGGQAAGLESNPHPMKTMALLPNSLAVDVGDNINCIAVDQRDEPRPFGTHCDMGAYEYQPNLIYLPMVIKP